MADLISSIIGDFKNNTSNDAQTSIYAIWVQLSPQPMSSTKSV